jgi:hypothetical protein
MALLQVQTLMVAVVMVEEMQEAMGAVTEGVMVIVGAVMEVLALVMDRAVQVGVVLREGVELQHMVAIRMCISQ